MLIDLDKFKAKPPTRDITFWVALAPVLLVLVPSDVRDWLAAHWKAVAAASGPLMVWLGAHGYLRGQGAGAAGEVAKSHTVMNPLTGVDFDAEAEAEAQAAYAKLRELAAAPVE